MGQVVSFVTIEERLEQEIYDAEQLRLSLIPECPICGDKKEQFRRISKCKHAICKACLKAYISVDIKNISKYPLKCFQFECQELLTYKDVEYAFKYDQKMLEIYEKFSIMKAIPEQQRFNCPKCEMLFFIQPRQSFNNKNCGAKNRSSCANSECGQSFNIFKHRHHCQSCKDVFCYYCLEYRLPSETATETVRSCHRCWLKYYRAVCTNCQFRFCLECKQKWHPKIDCVRIKQRKTIARLKKEIEDKKSKQSMLSHNYRQCPGCRTFIEKKDLTTCNHMTHDNCPNPIPIPGVNQTHFCYCCSEVLYGSRHNEEKDGQSHFPNGVFKDCRKHNAAIQTRNREQSKLTKEIQLLTNKLNYIKK